MKAVRTVKRITFADGGVIAPRSFSLLFNIDLTGDHAHSFLVLNVSRAPKFLNVFLLLVDEGKNRPFGKTSCST